MSKSPGFLEDRLGLFSGLRSLGGTVRPPKESLFIQSLGFATLAVLALVAVSGVALSFHYVPSVEHAYDSVRVIENEVPGGSLLRGLHYQGSSVLVVLAFLDLVVAFFLGLYKKPREFVWIFSIGLLVLIIMAAFTGYLLPWDQNAWFATKVRLGIAASAPVIGEDIRRSLQGGGELNAMSLTRFFTLHSMLVPLLMGLLLMLRARAVRRHGMSPAGLRIDEPGTPEGPFPSRTTWRKALLGILAVTACFTLADQLVTPLGSIADPADSNFQPRPEWYFFGPFEALKYFGSGYEAIGSFWIPNALLVLLVLLPFYDRNPERKLRRRPLCLFSGLGFLTVLAALTIKGSMDKPTHYLTPQHPLHADPELRLGYDLTRKEACFSCHTWTGPDGTLYGEKFVDKEGEDEAPPFEDMDFEPEDFVEVLVDPPEDMPAYPHLSEAQRYAIAKYTATLRSDG